ncbi:hypothetical protein BVX98_05700 [bacterium F11]|nr:hypothetical protein BVX98_05700 [bacterium F11]
MSFFVFLVLFLIPFQELKAESISGLVRNLFGTPLSNIRVDISGSSNTFTVTNGAGQYSFPNLVNGNSYSVSPNNVGYAFTPSTRTYPSLSGDQTNQNFTHGKWWDGEGSDNLASTAENWSGDEAPGDNDIVIFGSTNSTKGCVWDLTVLVDTFTMTVDYSSSVNVSVGMNLGHLTIAGGELHLGSSFHTVSGDFLHIGGTFTSALNGIVKMGTGGGDSPQTVSILINNLGGNSYSHYFYNFQIDSDNTVSANSDLIIDGTFNISQGTFDAGSSTMTLTGGTQVGAGTGSLLNWRDGPGVFLPGSGQVVFANEPRRIRLTQEAGNSFHNLEVNGKSGVEMGSHLVVNGDLQVGQSGSSTTFDLGNLFTHTINGQTMVGPATEAGSPSFSMRKGEITFNDNVVIGTATFSMDGGELILLGNRLEVISQGTFQIKASTTTELTFGHGSVFQLSSGTLLAEGESVIMSTSPGQTRFAMQMDGTVDIQNSMTINSVDINGFRMGPGANPVNLNSMNFTNGIVGGAAFNFDPVTVASVTIQDPQFDATISTNVRANLNPLVIPEADINVIGASGNKSDPSFEVDPDDIVNWGLQGTPTGFTGTTQDLSSITWSWTIVNYPLGFHVKNSTGGTVSPTLGQNTTYWTEVGLATNTSYTRYVDAFTDVSTASSNSFSRYTLAAPVLNPTPAEINITSVSLSWDLNTNPSSTVYSVESSTDNSNFVFLSSGTYASLHPIVETGLIPFTSYYYRFYVENGDGVIDSSPVTVVAMTLPIPPPWVYSISPSTGLNLGTMAFSVSGRDFQSSATLKFIGPLSQVIIPDSFSVEDSETIVGTVNVTGAWAGTWDVFVENPDGKRSTGSGEDIFTISDAPSQGSLTIQNYVSSETLTFLTAGSETTISVEANAMGSGALGNGRFYISVDPENNPLQVDPAVITTANNALQGRNLVPGSMREALAFRTRGPYTSMFASDVTVAIHYPDTNNDNTLDNIYLNADTLRLMTLNESTSRWEDVSSSSVDLDQNWVIADIVHFSVFGLFGISPSENLSQVKIYPNPWKPKSGGLFDAAALTFEGLTLEGTIRIYTLDARLVKELKIIPSDTGQKTWDGKNKNGDEIASGVYLIHFETVSGEKKMLKLGVER